MGDINYKFGGNALDNGYLILTHYRIPRTHLLMKYAQVTGLIYSYVYFTYFTPAVLINFFICQHNIPIASSYLLSLN